MNKYILKTITSETDFNTKEYKSLRLISDELKLEYHVIQSIYAQTKSPNKKGNHPFMKELLKKYEIKDKTLL